MPRLIFALLAFVLCGRSYAQGIYGGQSTANLLENPGFELGINGWYPLSGQLREEQNIVIHGAKSLRATSRTQTWMGPAQNILPKVQVATDYLVNAWVRISGAATDKVILTLKKVDGQTTWTHLASAIVADSGWVNLVGAFNLPPGSNPSELTLYVEGPQAGVDILLDYCSLRAAGDWRAQANARIEQHRKRDWNFKIVDVNGVSVDGASIELNQLGHHFAFGTAINEKLLSDMTYQQFFLDNFEWAVFENQTKWPHNEAVQGVLDYSNADAMYAICEQNGIPVRGHCVFWAVDQYIQSWVKALDTASLGQAMESRINSVVGRYKGKFEHWDVNNEMLHGSWYQDQLGANARATMFKKVKAVDSQAKLFVNDYSVVAGGRTSDYLSQIQSLQSQGAPVDGIGAQCHFSDDPIPSAVYARLDLLASTGLPIWVTEFDVGSPDPQIRASMLERFYRTVFSHSAVEGILMWGFWAGAHWRGPESALVDLNWTINAAGQQYFALIDEWTTRENGLSTANGRWSTRAFHGEYEILVTPPGPSQAQRFVYQLRPNTNPKHTTLTVF